MACRSVDCISCGLLGPYFAFATWRGYLGIRGSEGVGEWWKLRGVRPVVAAKGKTMEEERKGSGTKDRELGGLAAYGYSFSIYVWDPGKGTLKKSRWLRVQ